MMNFHKKQLILAITLTLFQSTAYALPTGGTIVSGDGAIANVGNIANITQSSDKLIINWEDFSINKGETVNFLQTANQIALNRVLGNNLSEINGKLNATGQIFLVNQNGVTFGGGSEVNVGGIAVSTKDITNENFNKGLYKFTGDSSKSIINNGTMNIAEGGYAALIAEAITNKGTVAFKGANANNTVALGAGKTVTLSFGGPNQRISMVVNEAAVNAVIYNKQAIDTQGGQIFMTAKAANALQANIVNTGSSLKANTIKMEGGVISLLDANALQAAEKTTLTAASEIRAGELAKDAAKFDTAGGVGFTKYNVINNINELQGIKDDLKGKYMLGSDIDASATVDWNEKQGFIPIGNSDTNYFKGTLDGLGFTVDKLRIKRPDTDYVGLFGYVGSDGVIANIGMTNSIITGKNNVGGLVGLNGGSIDSSYNTGTVSGTGIYVGGLVGQNNGGSINSRYNTGAVGGTVQVGGLVGHNRGSISGSYNTGEVSGTKWVGGLVGYNSSSDIKNLYYLNTSASTAISEGTTTGTNVASKTAAELKTAATYDGWEGFADTWRIYEGYTNPLLKAFLKKVTVTKGQSTTYNGKQQTIDSSKLTFDGANVDLSKIFAGSKKNAGKYQLGDLLYSDQQGYDIEIAEGAGDFTINKATLHITADNVTGTYGEKPDFTYSHGNLLGDDTTIDGLTGDASYESGAYKDGKTGNVGSYDITIGTGTLNSTNYEFEADSKLGTATIKKATLYISANDAANTVYGSTTKPDFSYKYSGLVNGDTTIDGLGGDATYETGAFKGDKTGNAGTYDINIDKGTLSSTNYDFVASDTNIGKITITKATLTITAGDVEGIYGTKPDFSHKYSGLVNGDTADTIDGLTGDVTYASGAYDFSTGKTGNAGTYKDITVDVSDLNSTNYEFVADTKLGTATINKAKLNITANDVTGTYGKKPEFSYGHGNLANGDTMIDGLTGDASYASGAYDFTTGKTGDAGQYDITIGEGNLTSTNYEFVADNTAKGTAIINKADLIFTANGAQVNINDKMPNFTGTITGYVNGDTAEGLGGTNSWITDAADTSKNGSYGIYGKTDVDYKNYNIVQAPSNKTAFTVQGVDQATLKVFDMITTSNMQMLRSPIVQEEWNLEPDTERLNSLYVLPLELDYYVLEKAGRQYILD